MKKFVVKSGELSTLLDRMRSHGVRTFLLTNSGFEFSNVRTLSYNLTPESIFSSRLHFQL